MKHLFFDWDGTLWDFETNSARALKKVFEKHNLQKYCKSFENFIGEYEIHNQWLWQLYRQGEIKKQQVSVERFGRTFQTFGINNSEFAEQFSAEYLLNTTLQTQLFPFAKEIVVYLHSKYHLHIITNGFTEVQYPKIENSGIAKYFSQIITSEEAGVLKPNAGIFEMALKKTNAKIEDSWLIGDDLEADIKGAVDFGMNCIFVNYKKNVNPFPNILEIKNLEELKKIF